MTEVPKTGALTHKLFAGLRAYASFRFPAQIASWLGTVYVVRHLTSRAMGQYGVAFVVFTYLAMVYDGTLLEALVQHPPRGRHEKRAAFSLVAGIGLILALVAAGCAYPIARWVGDPTEAPLVLVVGAIILMTSLSILPHAMLTHEMAFPRLARIGAVQSLCVTVTTVVLAWKGAGAWALIGGLLMGAGVRMVLLNAARWGLTWPTPNLSQALHYLRFGGVLLLDNILWRCYVSLDTVLLGRWAGTGALGFYTLAQQTADLPLEKISKVVNDISLPAYATLREDRSASAGLLLETIRMHATVGFPAFWGLAAVASLLVPVIFGDVWRFAIFPLIALSAVAPLRLIGGIETPAMTGLGRPGVLVKTKSVIVPCMTIALLIGCWFGGIDGAALAWATVFPLCYGFAFRWVLRAAGVAYVQFLSVIRGPAAAAAVMVGIVLAWKWFSRSRGQAPLLGLAVAIAIGVLAYGAALYRIDPVAFRLARVRGGRLFGLKVAT